MTTTLDVVIKNQNELNCSYLPFIKDGGLFIPTSELFQLGDDVILNLQIPGYTESMKIEGKVVWITPGNSLYQTYHGIGIQFTGENAKVTHDLIKSHIDTTQDVGGYAYGIVNASNL